MYQNNGGTLLAKYLDTNTWGSDILTTSGSERKRHFGKKKLQSTPNLNEAGPLFGPQIWIWKDLGLVCFGVVMPHFQVEFI